MPSTIVRLRDALRSRPRHLPILVASLVVLATAGACGTDADSGSGADAATESDAATAGADTVIAGEDATSKGEGTPTWHATIAPIIQSRCSSCHVEGGIAPFRLDRAEDWEIMGKPAVSAMESGRMPPWPADPTCGSFAHRGDMPKAEIAQVSAWVNGGRPLGDPKDAPKPKATAPVTFKPTHSLPMPVAFTPPKDNLDTYRCFLLDLDTSKDRFIKATQVVPGSGKLVHHVLVYALEGDHVTKAEKADKAEAGPGYTCFGGPLPNEKESSLLGFTTGFPNQLAAWVPGLQPSILGDDYAIRVKKGSRVVMQVHYNVPAGQTEADQTKLELVVTDTPPKRVLITRPLVIRDLNIPAGDKAASHSATYRYYGDSEVRIHSMTAHMHLLGSRFESEVRRKDGTTECALRIPEWDFAWQQAYRRPHDDPIVLKDGDGMMLRCVYDNSVANQPRVNGKQVTPKNVTWGDGTLDEMCLLYLTMSEPYEVGLAADAPACQGISACQPACDPKSPTTCIYDCDKTEPVCGTCAIGQLISCAGLGCAASMLGAQDCLTNCLIGSLMLDANPASCLTTQCKSKWEKVQACLDPKIAKGDCDKHLKTCGVAFGAGK